MFSSNYDRGESISVGQPFKDVYDIVLLRNGNLFQGAFCLQQFLYYIMQKEIIYEVIIRKCNPPRKGNKKYDVQKTIRVHTKFPPLALMCQYVIDTP